MEEPRVRIDYFLQYKGRIVGTLLGFITSILVVTLGWLKAIYFLICVSGGYFVGKRIDGKENLFQQIKKVFSADERG